MDFELYQCRHGAFWHFATDTCVGESLRLYGEWAESEVYFLSSFLRPGDTVLDVGAHVGSHAIPLSRAVFPTGRIVAVEAQRDVFALLCANVPINRASSVFCHHALVTDRVGVEDLSMPRRGTSRNYAAKSFVPEAPNESVDDVIPVLGLTLDSLELAECRLIKMDVEQMEHDVLLGAAVTIERFRPIIYFEQASEAGFSDNREFLERLGYRLFWHRAPAFNRNNYNRCGRDIFNGSADTNILAVPNAELERVAWASGQLVEVKTSNYFPPASAIEGWELPRSAYRFYENGMSFASAPVSPQRELMAESRLRGLHEEVRRLEEALRAMTADRALAQQVLEAQHAEIQRLRTGSR